MYLYKLLLTFVHFPEAPFGAKAELIVTALTTEPMLTLVPEPIPLIYPQRPALVASLATYKASVVAAADGSKSALTQRREDRAALAQLLKDFAPHLEATARAAKNITILELSGYDLRRPVVHPTTNGVPVAPVVFPRRGKVSRSVITRVKPLLPNAGTYEGEYAVGDGAYQGRITCNAGSRITFTDLELGKLHNFRVRGIGSKGPGDWSDPVGIIVT